MSAEILRRAAALMRERAQAARSYYAAHHPKAGQEVPWFSQGDIYGFDDGDSPHIIGMSPAVALAVADWLDDEVADAECYEAERVEEIFPLSLAVARAYLGAS